MYYNIKNIIMNKYLDAFYLVYIFSNFGFIYFYYYFLRYFSNRINIKFERLNLIKKTSIKLLNLNVNYVKIIQALCFEKDYLTDEEQDYLITFTNNTPYNDNDIDYNLIEHLKNNGVDFDSCVPINSGISAVVYKGEYNKKEVAIKILKNNAELKMFHCIDTLEFIFNILSKIPFIKNYNFENLLKLNKKLMLEQVDFIIEKNNMIKFKNSCKHYEYINIPNVYNLFSISNKENNQENNDKYLNDLKYSKNYIIMDFINGFNFTELIKLKNKNLNNIYGENILRFALIGTLMTGSVHCDLHPGNFILNLKDIESDQILSYDEIVELNINNQITQDTLKNKYAIILNIIDFGLSIFPSQETQSMYYEYLKKLLIEKNTLELAKYMVSDLNENQNYSNYDNIIKDLDNHLSNYVNEELDLKFIYSLNKIFSKHNLKFVDSVMKIQISLATSALMTKNLIGESGLKNATSKILKDIIKINQLISFD